MTIITEHIDKETLQKLMEISKINSLDELKKCISEIDNFNKENFLEKMNLNDEQLQGIGLNDENLYKDKETWIESINEAIKEQPKKQDSAAAVITPNGSFVIRVCGKDQEKTMEAIRDIYRDCMGNFPQPTEYENLDDFLNNSNLPAEIKQNFSEKDFPLAVHTLKFDSTENYEKFRERIQPLLDQEKLRILGETPTMISPQPNSTAEREASVNQQTGPATTPRPRP